MQVLDIVQLLSICSRAVYSPMASLVVNGNAHIEPVVSQHIVSEANEIGNIRASEPYFLSSDEAHFHANEVTVQEEVSNPDILDKGYLEHGYVLLALSV